MSSKFKQVGITKNNIPIYSGLFYIWETHGIPLDIVISILFSKNIMPSWIHLYDDFILNGTKPSSAISRIYEAICEAGDKNLADVVISRLKETYKI